MYKKATLDNGLRIIANPMTDRQSLALGIWINVGSRYETQKERGISHFLEHLVFKGTKNYSCNKIKESIEGIGGSLNGFTSEELTCYLAKIPADYQDLALNILSDMVINPVLLDADIQREKAVILEEIKMYKDLPQSYVYELLDGLLWRAHPLGSPVIGTADSVSKINRKDLCFFKQKYYTPSNIVISVAGQLNYKKFLGRIKKLFSCGDKQNIPNFLKAEETQTKPQLKVFCKATEQTHLALGFRGFKRNHPLRHAQSLLHIVLGANMSSRLFNELREKKGLAYDIGTAVKRYYDTGSFVVHAGTDNSKIIEALKLILKEIKKTKKELVSYGEFKRAKEFYMGQIKLALEDTLEHMLWIGETTAALNKTYSLGSIIKEVNKATREDIRNVARYLFKERNLNLALIGPIKESQKFILGFLKMS